MVKLADILIMRNKWSTDTLGLISKFTDRIAIYNIIKHLQQVEKALPESLKESLNIGKSLELYLVRLSKGTPMCLSHMRSHFIQSFSKIRSRDTINNYVTPNMPIEPYDFKINGIGFHRILLSQHSDYLRNMFAAKLDEDSLDIPFYDDDVDIFHQYIYGKVTNSKDRLFSCYKLADYLVSRSWIKSLVEKIAFNVDSSNIIDAIEIYQKTKSANLYRAIGDVVCNSSLPDNDYVIEKLLHIF